jgi:hypothetical protein
MGFEEIDTYLASDLRNDTEVVTIRDQFGSEPQEFNAFILEENAREDVENQNERVSTIHIIVDASEVETFLGRELDPEDSITISGNQLFATSIRKQSGQYEIEGTRDNAHRATSYET